MKSSFVYLTFFVLISLFASIEAQAQRSYKYSEYGVSAGNMVMTGQLTTNNSVGNWIKEQGGRFGLFMRKSPRPWFTYGLETNYGWASIHDRNHGRADRGGEFRTDILNINVATEFLFLKYGKYNYAAEFSPYFKLGGGYTAFSPEVSGIINVEPGEELHPYSYSSFNVFFGFGAKFRTSYKTSLAVELVFHNSGDTRLAGLTSPQLIESNYFYSSLMISFSRLIF